MRRYCRDRRPYVSVLGEQLECRILQTALPIFCAVQFIDAFDVSSMGPALPEIQCDLAMS